MHKYWVLVDNEKIGEFCSIAALSDVQRKQDAVRYADHIGHTGKVEIVKAQTKWDFKVWELV